MIVSIKPPRWQLKAITYHNLLHLTSREISLFSVEILVCLLRTICCDLRKLTLHCKNRGGKATPPKKYIRRRNLKFLRQINKMALKRKAAPGQDLMTNASHINLNWSLWKRGGLGHQLKPRSNITTFPIRRSCSGRPLGQIIIAQIFSFNWLDHTSSLLDHLFPSMVMVMLLEIRKKKFAAKINSQKRIIFALDSPLGCPKKAKVRILVRN